MSASLMFMAVLLTGLLVDNACSAKLHHNGIKSTSQDKNETNTSTPLSPHPEQRACHLEPFQINFTSYPAILLPKNVDIGICVGTCSKSANSRHSLRNVLIQSANIDSVPEPCCVPTAVRDLQVLLRLQGKHVVELLTETVATQCGCAV